MRPTKNTSSKSDETSEPIGQRTANKGKLSDKGTEALLRAYRKQRATGILTFDHPRTGRWQLYLMEGDIIAATAELEDLRLGRMLYRSGQITRGQLDNALSLRRETFTVGEALVSQKAITAEVKSEALTAQFREILFSTFLMPDATWSFQPQDAIFADNLQLFFDSDELIAEGSRLANEVSVLAQALEAEDHVYQRAGSRSPRSLKREQEDLLRLIDGQRSTAELFVLSPFERLATLQLLSQFIESGLIRKVGQRPASRPELLPSYPYLPDELREDVRKTDLIPRRALTVARETVGAESTSRDEVTSAAAKGGRKSRSRTTSSEQTLNTQTSGDDAVSAGVAAQVEAAMEDLNPVSDALAIPSSQDNQRDASDSQVNPPSALSTLESMIAATGTQRPANVPEDLQPALASGDEALTATAAAGNSAPVETGASADSDPVLDTAIEAVSSVANPLEDINGASAEAAAAPHPDEPEIQELWSDEPVFQPRDHSNPSAGVFLSGDSVLDTVDLSHFNPMGLATDIPLDGIVETAGVEDYEHEDSVSTSVDDEEHYETDDEHFEDDAAGEDSSDTIYEEESLSDRDFDSVPHGREDIAAAGEGDWTEDEEVVPLSQQDIVGVTGFGSENAGAAGRHGHIPPPIYEEDTLGADALGEDALSNLDEDEEVEEFDDEPEDLTDDSDVEELREDFIQVRGVAPGASTALSASSTGTINGTTAKPAQLVLDDEQIEDLEDVAVLRQEDIAESSSLGAHDEEVEDLSALDIAQIEPVGESERAHASDTDSLELEALQSTIRTRQGLGEPLLPTLSRAEGRNDSASSRRKPVLEMEDEGSLSGSIQPLDLIEDFSDADSLLGLDSNSALFKTMQPIRNQTRPAARAGATEVLTPEEESLLSNISGIFRARSSGLRDKRTTRSGRRAYQEDLKRAGVTVSLNSTQKSLLRERSEMYNHIYSVIFAHLARKLGRDRTRSIFQEFFAPGNGSYPEMFQGLTFKGDGMVDSEQLLRNLEAYPTHRPVQLLESSLSDIFHFLIRQIDQVLDPVEQSQMMDGLTPLFNLLNKRNEGSA